jgi:hypothetical protein
MRLTMSLASGDGDHLWAESDAVRSWASIGVTFTLHLSFCRIELEIDGGAVAPTAVMRGIAAPSRTITSLAILLFTRLRLNVSDSPP